MPLFWLSAAFLMGIVLGEWLGWSTTTWLLLATFALGLLILSKVLFRVLNLEERVTSLVRQPLLPSHLAPRVPLLLLLVVFPLGAARYQSVQPQLTPDFIAWYNDTDMKYVIEGLLKEPADRRDDYTNLRVQVEKIRPAGEYIFRPVGGLLLAKVPPGGDWRYGDRVRLRGRLVTPQENEEFSYRDYLARQGIYAYLSCGVCETCDLLVSSECARLVQRDQGRTIPALIYALKARALETVYQIFPDPEASLLAGILLGVEAGIPQDVQDAFKDTGTSHIIAISGFNFVIIAGLFMLAFGRLFGRWRGALAAIVGIALYAVLVGGNAAVVRAAIMSVVAMFAVLLGRRQSGINTLAFVAALMAWHNPHVLWDVGFQLSFMATLGLLLYAEPLTEAFMRWATPRFTEPVSQRLSGPVGEYFLFTLAAQITTLAVIIYHFQRLSLVSLLANPLILPAQPPVMILGGLSVVLGIVYPPLGQAAAYLAWPFLVYTVRIVELMAAIPGGALSLGRVSLPAVLLFYTLLFSLPFIAARLKVGLGERFEKKTAMLAGGCLLALGIVTVVVWQAVLFAPDGRLHLTVLDVGSGDGLLIQTPTGRYLLIDGGSSTSRLSDALGRRLPLGRRKLDYLVVAAAGEEQLAALPVTLERFPPANVLWSGPPLGDYNARRLQETLVEAQISQTTAQVGQVLDLGEGATLRVLDVTRKGSVLLLEWEDFSALLPIGLEFESLSRLSQDHRIGPVSALLLTESGHASLNPPEWILRWDPQVVLLSVAADDRLGRPSPEALDAVNGYTLLRTDRNGWLHLSTDGEQLWIEVERE